MNSSSTLQPTAEGSRSASGAPNLPAGFTDTVADQSTTWTEATTLRPEEAGPLHDRDPC